MWDGVVYLGCNYNPCMFVHLILPSLHLFDFNEVLCLFVNHVCIIYLKNMHYASFCLDYKPAIRKFNNNIIIAWSLYSYFRVARNSSEYVQAGSLKIAGAITTNWRMYFIVIASEQSMRRLIKNKYIYINIFVGKSYASRRMKL